MKVLIVAHGHPNLSKGGGEMAAYGHYEALREQGHDAYYLAWNSAVGSGAQARPIEQINATEWLIATEVDFFTFSSLQDEALDGYNLLLKSLQPDVVHFHHFIHLGIELPRYTKQIVPNAKVYMTLHEYLAICNNNGQMIKTDGSLCYRAAPADCHKCFPQISPEAFFMREGYIKNCLSAVDHFFSPSRFLVQRMVDWGIPKDRISYVENILKLPHVKKTPPAKKARIEKFGFFGQINPYKGLDIVLDGFELARKSMPNAKLYINGSMSSVNSAEYNAKLRAKIAALGSSVIVNGPYSPDNLPERLAEVGWLVMGSRWWENSPVVIQEAFAACLPVILPDIGGMAEQFETTTFGFLYSAGNAEDLAKVMRSAGTTSEVNYAKLLRKQPFIPSNKEIVNRIHMLNQLKAA